MHKIPIEQSNHAMAAVQHEQAAQYHSSASRHFEDGKDFAHTAHEAILAHGHSLKALEHGWNASRNSSRHAGNTDAPPPHRASPMLERLMERVCDEEACTNGQQHHQAAASHHLSAAVHERKAAALELTSDFDAVARESSIARGHGELSLFHSDEAAKLISL